MTIRHKVHLLAKSYPRSGHHYITQALKSLYGEEFYYCEFYQPSKDICCKKDPCEKAMGLDCKLSMQKSHDFLLEDKISITNPGLKYIFFFRNFEKSILSRTKLRLIFKNADLLRRHNLDVNQIFLFHEKSVYRKALSILDENRASLMPEDYLLCLSDWADYYIKFMSKWRPISISKSFDAFTVNYDNLTNENLQLFFSKLQKFISIEPVISIEQCCIDNPLMSSSEKLKDYSLAAEELVTVYCKTILNYSKIIQATLKIEV
jgi:hypothetical protein